jgi:hypothetical protein
MVLSEPNLSTCSVTRPLNDKRMFGQARPTRSVRHSVLGHNTSGWCRDCRHHLVVASNRLPAQAWMVGLEAPRCLSVQLLLHLYRTWRTYNLRTDSTAKLARYAGLVCSAGSLQDAICTITAMVQLGNVHSDSTFFYRLGVHPIGPVPDWYDRYDMSHMLIVVAVTIGGTMSIVAHRAREQFREARSQAFVGALLDLIRRQPRDLLSFEDIRACVNIRGQRALGIQIVPLTHIVGSEGRYRDFDRHFLPRSDHSADRWCSIQKAIMQGVDLPVVELYKMSDVYFVRDGNHRISVARRLGYGEIDADVTELLVDVSIGPDLSLRTLLFTQEYSDFLEWTNLHSLRPDEHIVFSDLGSYLDLVRHINLHRYTLARTHRREISRDEAVASWYDTVYLPVVRVISEHKVLKHLPGRTEADLYLWLMDQQLRDGDAHADSTQRGNARVSSKGLNRAPGRDAVLAAAREVAQRLGSPL